MRFKDVKIDDGCVLVVNEGGEIKNVMIYHNRDGELVLSGETIWFPLSCFDSDGEYWNITVLKVYGRENRNRYAHQINLETDRIGYGRELLWEREETEEDPEEERSDEKSKQTLEELMEESKAELMKKFGMSEEKAKATVGGIALLALLAGSGK